MGLFKNTRNSETARASAPSVSQREDEWSVTDLSKPATMAVCVLAAAASLCCGPRSPAPSHAADAPEAGPAVSKPSPLAAATPEGLHAVYNFKYKESGGRVTIWSEGPHLKVLESWTSTSGSGRRWGASEVLLLFDAEAAVLTIVNLTRGKFTRLDALRMAEFHAEMTDKGHLPAAPDSADASGAEPLAPTDQPQKSHPNGCAIFHRTLPFGLEEESCFRSFARDGVHPGAPEALISFGAFVNEAAARIGELEAVSAIAKAFASGNGILVSQFKFGISLDIDQESAPTAGGMESWDRTITLERSEPATLLPEELELPPDLQEAFGIVPWHTPFLDVTTPSNRTP